MKKAVIVGYLRSPFDFAHKGKLAGVRADDMATTVVKDLITRTGVSPEGIEDLILGCSFPEGEQGLNLGRLLVLNSGLPDSVAGMTINRFCGSSMQAIHIATGTIACGAGDAFICAGVESMSHIPMGGFNFMPNETLYETRPEAYMSMGETAENVAKKYNISRQDQETFAVSSQEKAAQAQQNGNLSDEIVPIKSEEGLVEKDGCIRPETTIDILAGLPPAFDQSGTVTAGTSSPLTDGAAATLVCSEDFCQSNGLKPLATVRAFAVAGCDPKIMGMGPVAATQKLLQRTGMSLGDIDIVELNEAFASQALACIQELSLDPTKINLDGGAIALGHPLGATGARITGKLATLLQREGKQFGLATQCIGGGQGIATLLERES